jgi:hypothetical protein
MDSFKWEDGRSETVRTGQVPARAALPKRGCLAAATPRNPDRAREFSPFKRECIDLPANDLTGIALTGAPLRQSASWCHGPDRVMQSDRF